MTPPDAVRMSFGGDNNGTVLVGDHNVVHYTENRTIVTEREGGPVPVRLREHPDRRWLPDSAAPLIGRDRDLARIRGRLAERGAPVLVYGPPGIGKSAVLARIARDAADAGEDVVYLSAAGLETEDIVQELFEACYDSPGYLPPPGRLRRLMGKVRALVVIDGYEGSAESLEKLLDVVPGAGLLLASTRRLLGAEGHVLPLGGLAEADAVALTTAEAVPDPARPLSEEESAAVRELCRAANGHPRTLLQAAALMRASGVLPVAADPGTAARALVASLDGDGSAAARALAALPGVPVPAPVLGALAGLSPDGTDAALAGLRRLRLAEPAGPGHLLTAGAPVPRGRNEAAGYAARLTSWVRNATRAEVAAGAAAVVAVLRAAVREEAHDPARALARAAAPLLGRSLRWGAWGQVLAFGLTAAANAGAADDVAYFEEEEKVRKRALGLLLGLGGGGLGAAGAVAFLGKGGSAFSAQALVIAAATTVAVTAAAVAGVRLATPGAAEPSAAVITPLAARPRPPATTRPPAGGLPPIDTRPPIDTHPPIDTARRDQSGSRRDGPGRDTMRDRGRDPATPRPGTPRLILSDGAIERGGSTGARATGFEPGERVTFTWAGPGGGGELGVRTADGRGVAVLADAVPAGAAAGRYTITARGGSPDRRAGATLTIRERPAPRIRFVRVPSSVPAEAAFEVVAAGFDAGESVRLTLGDASLARAAAGAGGQVTLRGDAPAGPATYRLAVTGRDGDRSASTLLTVTPKPPPDLSGRWGGYLTFRDVGGGSYEGTRYGPDWVEPHSGCTYPSGDPEVHLFGQPPTYQGEIRWIYGVNGKDCGFEWGAATFTLSADGDSLRVSAQDPRDPGRTMSQTLRRN
ncbi:AAA family ATPase [Nonomuraea sp. NPDC050783]|uniref:AAA family ATPase n=1 Tax=Nonomuraea sp. NPDC050783 TaxID=3154634 RepID=UPI003466101A